MRPNSKKMPKEAKNENVFGAERPGHSRIILNHFIYIFWFSTSSIQIVERK